MRNVIEKNPYGEIKFCANLKLIVRLTTNLLTLSQSNHEPTDLNFADNENISDRNKASLVQPKFGANWNKKR